MTRAQKKKRNKRIGWSLLIGVVAIALCGFLLKFGFDTLSKSAYPLPDLPYQEYVSKYAADYGVEPALVYGVMATESSFKPKAVSNAGAMGLMQLTPDTFEWAQMRMGTTDKGYTADDLFDPAVNIQYGIYVLSLLREDFSSTATLLAAYNAGRTTVLEWLADERYSTDGKTLYDIPIEETRQYVLKVLQAQESYQKLYDIQ